MEPIPFDAFRSYAHEDNDRQRSHVLGQSESLPREQAELLAWEEA